MSVLFADDEGTDADADPCPAQEVPPPPTLRRLAELLGIRCYYREIFDPYNEDVADGEVRGDLIDDLGDIYSDLECGLVHWRSGDSGSALWEWRFRLESHWAEHATSALRALFALSAWHGVAWPAGAPLPHRAR